MSPNPWKTSSKREYLRLIWDRYRSLYSAATEARLCRRDLVDHACDLMGDRETDLVARSGR